MLDVQQSYTDRRMTFGNWLKEARLERGYSLRELALRANNVCTFSYIAQLERGDLGKKGRTLQPDIEIVEALATALDKDVDEARLAAGYAPTLLTAGKPKTLNELLTLLERAGIENLHFSDGGNSLHEASEETLQAVLDAVRIAVEVTLQRQQTTKKENPLDVPTNATDKERL